MSIPAYSNPSAYDLRKLKPLEAYLESLWKPIFTDMAKKYIHENDTIADFGCGTLAHINLMSHASKIYAVDANNIMLEFGLSKVSPEQRARILPLCESALHTSIPSSSCSVIWSIGLTEYTNVAELFYEMTRVAKPDAVMLIQFPNAYNIVHVAIQILHAVRGTEGKTYRTASEIMSIAHANGWQIEQSISTGFYTPVPAFLIPMLSPLWKVFNSFGNNTFLVLRKPSAQ